MQRRFSDDRELQSYIIGVALGDGNLSSPNGRVTKLRISRDPVYPKLIETDGSVYFDRGYQTVMFFNIVRDLVLDVYHMIQALNFSPHFYSITNFNTKHLAHAKYQVRLARNVEKFLSIVQPLKA